MELLNASIEKADQILREKNPEIEEEERHKIAKSLGLGAIKYADLSSHRMSDYVFSLERMLKFEGNTAAFLMYAYVRVAGIKRKVGKEIEPLIQSHSVQLTHPTEIALGLHLVQFGEALNEVQEDLLPNRLTDYLYHLAEKFHAFFRDCRVEGSDQETSRLLLSEATARTLKTGLNILGLNTVERM